MIKRVFTEIFYFLTSRIFLKNLVGILVMSAILLLFTSWWMKCYTNHGESLQVHDYIGMELEDAISKAESRSFSIVVSDSLYVVGKRSNVVMEQSPKPLSRVKEKRTIYLTVTKKNADMITLPDLVGNYDFKQYSKKLKRLNVKSRIKERVFNNKYEENTIMYMLYDGKKIIDEDLKNGVKVPMGEVVEFVVTERGGTMVPIPDLVCMKFDPAKFLIGNYKLNIGSIIPDATVTNESSAYIWKQVPIYDPSQNIRMGEQINLYLTQYRPDNCSQNNQNRTPPVPQQPESAPPPPESDTNEESIEEDEFDG